MTVVPVNSGFVLQDDPATPRTDATVHFRDILPKPDHPRVAGVHTHSALSWCQSRREVPAPGWLINRLDIRNIERPYKGFSSDGKPDPTIFHYEQDEGAPVEAAVEAVNKLLENLPEKTKREVIKGDVADDDEFRAWSNPELYVNPGGIRLDETTIEIQELVHGVLKASLSPEGYKKAAGCTFTNHFLGELVNGLAVLNKDSYNFRLFLPPATRAPSLTEPWGWSFFGHHLCLAVCFVGKRMIIGPTFMGAEPDRIDVGPHEGLRLFSQEEIRALNLMRDLSPENQKRAQISEGMDCASGLPEDRWNPFDERHLGGAHQDNRIVPFEGCPISAFTPEQREEIYAIIQAFNIYLPEGPMKYKMQRIRKFEDQTYFAWIGKFGLGDPYYFRIHSPATFCEFDFHCGIFLTNTSPAKCHVHTVNRLPNCEDYGKALIRQWKEEEQGKN
ncbi:hypothetical protein C349_00832 [Cryptococcus neoformans var. grubii Br795]|uniref:Uncharacterized protein n=1 Tax=Cryptococcus neoformans Tu259-1 TaxID=1230072 RepID=A0A854QMB8_CRYNE|nr:hypothetical protein C361_00855 [Cryptococcus neoformans var. grubii Tu259-1]OXG54450.1 hypothetical protein C355_00851 [Cryptococcus neoformans var. grubii Th84]OXG87843.1 hypothetical protein C350_00851 [Cryptococcus neoformans var. grubii MW-RSA36]OXG91817.1 hypothetical protein C349_00832 [Cryptococcus neoformans var. grubii Br795]OXH18129.1 hypothetical protein J010_00831 [Cryptococcus neoformans var. grubii]OXL11330.1 hypothetical protein C348_00851 [Cryptococcus neoformans var. grubi